MKTKNKFFLTYTAHVVNSRILVLLYRSKIKIKYTSEIQFYNLQHFNAITRDEDISHILTENR